MKTKNTLLCTLLLSSLFITAQTVMNIHQSNGSVLQLPLNTIDSITYTISNPGNLATITTLPIGNISTSSATTGGNITSDGGTTITQRGVCWSTSQNPTTADNYTVNGSGTGNFTSNLSGLSGGTTYYVRAYAINSAGTSYGNTQSFTATSSSGIQYGNGVTDREGNSYQTVIIGNQEWMAENLKTTKYNDGTAIPNVTDNNQWSNLITGAWCNHDNSSSNGATYGKLYNWYAVNTNKLCPTGWHVPSDAEWTILTDYLAANGHSGTEGKALKATSGWDSNGNGTDDYGWNGLPGGYRHYFGYFYNVGGIGSWWSSSEYSASNAWSRGLNYDYDDVYSYSRVKNYGFSVRCLRD
jgi:uncharacterized protein (TIGR02145 family)